MDGVRSRLLSQPFAGSWTALIGLAALVASWLATGHHVDVPQLNTTPVFAGIFILGLALAYLFPVHLRHGTKMEMGTLPLFLMAALLPVPLAALAAGMGTAAGELSVRTRRGLYFSDIGSQIGRRIVVALLASAVIHLPASSFARHLLLLLAGALVFFVGEIVTAPLTFTPTTGERPSRVIVECLKDAGIPEGIQYLLGLVGAVVVTVGPWALLLLLIPIALLYRISKQTKELQENARAFLIRLADLTDARDPFTREHSQRVTRWVTEVLAEMSVLGQEAQVIATAARLHDIGKMAVPDAVLTKTEMLTPEEEAIMRQHPRIGGDMLQSYEVASFARCAAIVEAHHERWDGAGYPNGIAGTDIPFGARVIAVADSYDAMTSDRPYRAAMPADRATAILRSGSGTQWDPDIVSAFLRVIPRSSSAALDQPDSASVHARIPSPLTLAPYSHR